MRRLNGRQTAAIALFAAAVLLAMQLIPVDHSNPPVESDVQAPPAVMAVLKRSCHDCHSNETTWPWYSRVAPLSWFVAGHVHEGREHLNFSRWPTYDFDAQDLILREIYTVIRKDEMPLKTYLMGHPDARLSEQDKQTLLDWAQQGLPADQAVGN